MTALQSCPDLVTAIGGDGSGQTREKNGNTRIDTLRDIYGPDFAPAMGGDAHLRTLLDRTGNDTLSEYVKNRKR